MVKAVMIVEMMGRPKEHLETSIREYISKMDKFKDLKTIKKEFNEPRIAEEKKDLYTCFCEVEFECRDFRQLFDVVFDFMPSSVEILEPTTLNLTIDQATSIINNLSGRLHRYDEVVKIMKNREQLFQKEISVAAKVLSAYDLLDKDKKIKKEVLEKTNAKLKEKKEKKEKEKK